MCSARMPSVCYVVVLRNTNNYDVTLALVSLFLLAGGLLLQLSDFAGALQYFSMVLSRWCLFSFFYSNHTERHSVC